MFKFGCSFSGFSGISYLAKKGLKMIRVIKGFGLSRGGISGAILLKDSRGRGMVWTFPVGTC